MSLPPPHDDPAAPRFDVRTVHDQCSAIFRTWGFDARTAQVAADVMAWTDLSGIDSHGISMFVNYESLHAAGHLDTSASPNVVRETTTTALLDAQRGLGHPAAVQAMELAITKAHAAGMGASSVFNSHHFGAAGYYSAMAAREGLVGLTTSSARTTAVLPTGGAEPRLSTNPLAFAAPSRTHESFLLDMATSTVAINKIKVYDYHQRPLPEGWFLDGAGASVHDAGTALAAAWQGLGGGLTPLGGSAETGGHKGYGLSLMVQILSSALSGGALSATRPGDGPDNIGHFFLALDPGAFRTDGGFLDDVEEVIDTMHATNPVPGGEVLVPGEPEQRARRLRATHGIPLPDSLVAKLAAICDRTGAPFLLHP